MSVLFKVKTVVVSAPLPPLITAIEITAPPNIVTLTLGRIVGCFPDT